MKKNRCNDGIKSLLYQNLRRMRLTIGLIILTVFSSMAADLYSQTARFSLDYKNENIVNVLRDIEDQSTYRFFYNEEVDLDFKVDVNLSNKPISEILKNVFEDTGVEYEVIGRQIILKSKSDTKTVRPANVSGNVSDSSGLPLPGVSIVIKGTTNGTITDFNGKFLLSDVPSDATLIFSFVGMKTQEVLVAGQTSFNISMTEDAIGIEEVVAIGYGTVKKSDLIGSVASVDATDISAVPVSSIDQALQGRASGVQVIQNSGVPGAATTIRIRGTNSIQGGNNPLVVVDGFPITGGMEILNPNDIEKIEILKDASSTAIYGARATNGVIIVSTKKGKEGKLYIDFDSYYGIQDQSKKLDMLNAEQFMEVANLRAVNDSEPALFFPNPSDVTTDTDWIDELFDPSPIQSHTLTFSGGNDRIKFSHSFNYFNQNGILKNSHYIKGSMRNNLEVKMNDWLTIGNSILITRSDREYSEDGGNRAVSEAHLAPPTVPVYDENGNYSYVNQYPFSPGAMDNPMMWINEFDDQTLTTSILDNFYGLFRITPELTFKSSLGVDFSNSQGSWYKTRLLLDGAPGGKGGKSSYESYSLLNENILNYNKQFGDSKIDAIVGYNWQTFKETFFGASAFNYLTDDLGSNVLQAGSEPQPPYSGASEWGISSCLARVNYTLKDRYLFSATVRSDGSSRFSEGNKWATFPSLGFAWRLTEEEFMQDIDWISNLKLRTSWGKTGNQAVSPYQTWSRMASVETVMGDKLQIGYKPANMANPDLKWETTTQFDLGLDFGILNERVRFALDYYSKKTIDLLARVDLPSSSGYLSTTQNIGEMQNRGLEFSVEAGIIETDFKWDASFQISSNQNKILKLSKGADVFAPKVSNLIPSFHILREGEPISMFYGFVRDGYTDTGRNNYLDFAGRDAEGNLVMEADGQITDDDRRIIGSPHPDFTFGLSNTFTYKGLTLNVFIDGAQGFEVLWASKMGMQNSFSRGGNQILDVLTNHWAPGNTNAMNPIISSTNSFKQADDFIEDGSYVKIRTINLSYAIPTNNITWLRNAQVYLNAQNMFTFTKYSGYDPEVSSFSSGDLRLGVASSAYPSTKTITMGVKLGF